MEKTGNKTAVQTDKHGVMEEFGTVWCCETRCLHTEMAGNDGRRRVRVILWEAVLTTVRMERQNDAMILVQIKVLPLTSCVGKLILCFKL